MSFFDELKRRNVFRVGLAYVVGAWLLLQFTEVITELLSLPPTIGPIVVAAVAIGFPIALFLAWAYELTPDGVKRESDVEREDSITSTTGKKLNGLIMGLLATAVIVLLVDKFVLRGPEPINDAPAVASAATEQSTDESAAAVAAAEPEDIDPRSIAVLPFTNRSPMAEDEFFIDGIHDDLLTNLARIGELKVISRTSVQRFKETDTPIPEIAQMLGVATIMEGAVQRAGNMVRINVQLIDADSDEHLWAQIYDRELTTQNLFDIQSEIAGHIAEALQAQLTPEEALQLANAPTENLAAYSAYLRGLQGFARREIGTMKDALEEFQRAVDLDPDFAHAWAGIATVAIVLPSWGGLDPEEGRRIAESAAERAMELAPELGEANLALATVLRGEAAEKQFQIAVELLPSSAAAHLWYANQLQTDIRRFDEALALIEKAVELDPLASIYRHQLARHYLFAGHFAQAERELLALLEVDPDFFAAISFMSLVTAAQGRLDEAFQWNQRAALVDPSSPFPLFDTVRTLTTLIDEERLEQLIDELGERNPTIPPFLITLAETGLAVMQGRYKAAVELTNGLPNIPFAFDVIPTQAYFHAYDRNYTAARASFEQAEPRFFSAESQDAALRDRHGDACFVSFLLLKTGDEALGEALLEQTIDYIDTELPSYAADPEQWGKMHHCLAIQGDFEGALNSFERGIEKGDYRNWWEVRVLEYFDPLQGDPRFEAVITGLEQELARQRASIDAWEAAGGDS
ncbi:MAG: tetratricopeptide repeat protein [Pseudomonadota bacterium]